MSEEEAKNTYNKGLHKEHALNKGANDLSNCLVACTSCNSSKREKDYTEWYNEENENFTPERLEKINSWLNEDHKKYIK
jgi:ribosomal protein L11 methylase PrmA